MKNRLEITKKLPIQVISVSQSMMFTYPTRLAQAWKPGIRQIYLPEYEIHRPEIEISVRQGSTKSLGISTGKNIYNPHNIYKGIYKKIAPQIQMHEKYVYDARYDTDGNIAHILTNVAPALLAARDICPKITVLLRARACAMAINAYKLLGVSVLCTDKDVQANLVLATCAQGGVYSAWYGSLFGNLTFENQKQSTPEKIFISRKGTRSLINEREVEQILQEYGFCKVYYEDIPISEQWSTTKNARVIVGLHGAALASLVFNQNAVKVVELFHPGYVTNKYRNMTAAIGGSWCGVTGQITENVIKELDYKQKARSFALSPTKIDTNSLCMALKYLDTI